MDPISPFSRFPISQRKLTFSGVQPRVLQEVEKNQAKLRQDTTDLFGAPVDVFVRQPKPEQAGSVQINAQNPAPLHFASGVLRSLAIAVTGKDLPPAGSKRFLKEESGDMFPQRSGNSPFQLPPRTN